MRFATFCRLRERPFDFNGGGEEDFLKIIIRTAIRTNKIDRMTKQTKNIQDGVQKEGQENVKRQMGTN